MTVLRGAELSECGRYRWALSRRWNDRKGMVLFVGLNPSTADALDDDQTSRVCANYARRWGFGGLLIGNLFAWRSTDPAGLRQVDDPVGHDNDRWLKWLQSRASKVVCAWGDLGSLHGRDQEVLGFLDKPQCLVQLQSGRPGHPLYKSAGLVPRPFTGRLQTIREPGSRGF